METGHREIDGHTKPWQPRWVPMLLAVPRIQVSLFARQSTISALESLPHAAHGNHLGFSLALGVKSALVFISLARG